MFWGAKSFNQNVYFNTESVTDMRWMFAYADNFKQSLYFNLKNNPRLDNFFINTSDNYLFDSHTLEVAQTSYSHFFE